MPPKVIITPYLSSLIEPGPSYPPLPTANELSSVHGILSAKQAVLAVELEASLERQKKEHKKRKDRDAEGSEAIALAANAQSGAKLEAIEKARAEGNLGRKGSPAGVVVGPHSGGPKVKRERNSASPAPSNASSVGFKPQHPPITYGQSQHLKKNKKRNRVIDSDDDKPRERSTTLATSPPHAQGTSGLKLKLPQQTKQRQVDPSPAPSASTSIAGGLDFSLPAQPSRPLVPPRPGVQKPLKPGPKRQADVDEDFSNVKAPNQTAFTTFWSSVEPYLREIREDDLAMLGFKADAPESFEIPPKGRHYTEVWDEEDGLPIGSTPRVSVPNMRSGGGLSHFVPATELRDEVLGEEFKGLGTVTERVVAAMMGDKEGMETKKEAVKGRMAEEGSREALKVDVLDLEDRMKRELRSVMLLGEHEEFDMSKKDDDEITSALRQCQRQLLAQTTLNDARKARLAELAKDRLAFAEYTSALEGIEKSIESGWGKRVKKYGLTPKKGANAPPKPPVQENLKRLVATRQRWISTVGQVLKEKKGECYGLPTKSVYDGIGDDEERDEQTVDDAVGIDSGDED